MTKRIFKKHAWSTTLPKIGEKPVWTPHAYFIAGAISVGIAYGIATILAEVLL